MGEVVNEALTGIGILRLLSAQLHRNVEQIEAEGSHPGRAIALLDAAAIGQGKAAVKHGDVVEAEEAAFKHVVAGAIVSVCPPAVFEQQLAQGGPQKRLICLAALLAVDLVDPHCRPGADRRIGVGERPLIGGGLGAGGCEVGATQQHRLLLGHLRIEDGEGHRVEHQIPLAEIGVLPGIRHRDHMVGMESFPKGRIRLPAVSRWRGLGGIPLQPAKDAPAVVLLAPQQARQGGGVNQAVFGIEPRQGVFKELRRFRLPLLEEGIKGGAKGRLVGPGSPHPVELTEAQLDSPLLSRRQGALQQPGRLGAALGWINGLLLRTDQIAVKTILLIGGGIGLAVEALVVGLVIGEQPGATIPAEQLIGPQLGQITGDQGVTVQAHRLALLIGIAPGPGVAHPQGGQQGEGGRIGAAIDDPDANQQIGG